MPPALNAPLGSYEVTAKVRVGWDGRSRAGARHLPALKILFPRSESIRLPGRVPHKRFRFGRKRPPSIKLTMPTVELVSSRRRSSLSIGAIIPCRVSRTRLAREVVENLRERFGKLVTTTVIRENISRAGTNPSRRMPPTATAPLTIRQWLASCYGSSGKAVRIFSGRPTDPVRRRALHTADAYLVKWAAVASRTPVRQRTRITKSEGHALNPTTRAVMPTRCRPGESSPSGPQGLGRLDPLSASFDARIGRRSWKSRYLDGLSGPSEP